MPFANREVPEYAIRTLREVLDGNYRIIYRVVPGGVEIVTVFHGSMQLEELDRRHGASPYQISGAQGSGFQANIASSFRTASGEPLMRPARASGYARVPPR